jgi:hypothetical protein
MHAYDDRSPGARRCGAARVVLLSVLVACASARPAGGDHDLSLRGDSGAGRDVAPAGAAGGLAGAGGDTSSGAAAGSAAAANGGASAGSAAAATGGASAGSAAAAAGGVGAAGSAPLIDVADVADAQMLAMAEACSVIDRSSVHGRCEDAVAMGRVGCDEHVLYDECTYFEFSPGDPSHQGSPTSVCRKECVVLETSPFWNGNCEPCARSCPPPQQGVFVHELKVSDCLQRPLTPCVVNFGTQQANLDATLGALIDREAGWGTVRNGSVEIELEHGCVKRYYVSGNAVIPTTNEPLDSALTGVRFACAEKLSCVHIQGSDTLATP